MEHPVAWVSGLGLPDAHSAGSRSENPLPSAEPDVGRIRATRASTELAPPLIVLCWLISGAHQSFGADASDAVATPQSVGPKTPASKIEEGTTGTPIWRPGRFMAVAASLAALIIIGSAVASVASLRATTPERRAQFATTGLGSAIARADAAAGHAAPVRDRG